MKAIMISDKPKWCALMMNGKKNVEVRKGTALYKAIQKLIDANGYADIYVYCAKDKNIKLVHSIGYYYADIRKVGKLAENNLNGKVIFKFRCYKVEEIKVIEDNNQYENEYDYYYSTPTCGSEGDLWVYFGDKRSLNELSCLDEEELDEYLQHKKGCAIHISDLEIFDEPKELSEFRKYCNKHFGLFNRCLDCKAYTPDWDLEDYCAKEKLKLTKAPQSFMYVEVE